MRADLSHVKCFHKYLLTLFKNSRIFILQHDLRSTYLSVSVCGVETAGPHHRVVSHYLPPQSQVNYESNVKMPHMAINHDILATKLWADNTCRHHTINILLLIQQPVTVLLKSYKNLIRGSKMNKSQTISSSPNFAEERNNE